MSTNQNRVPEGVPTGGQFAASAKSEAAVSLDPHEFVPVPVYVAGLPADMSLDEARGTRPALEQTLVGLAQHFHTHPDAPCCDGDTTLADWQDSGLYPKADHSASPLGTVLTEADLPGQFLMTGPNAATYTDEDGHFYEMHYDRGGVSVKSQTCDAQAYFIPFDAKRNPMDPSEVLDALDSCRTQVADINGFNEAISGWFAKGEEGVPVYVEPQHDYDAGSVDVDGVLIGDFTRDDRDMDGATLKVWVDKGERAMQTEQPSFTVFKARRPDDSPVVVYRGEDRHEPLAHWENDALDSLIAHRSGRGGHTPMLRMLLRDSIKAADKRN